MNKVDFTKLGGDPLTLDNFEFSQNAFTEGIKGLASVWQAGTLDPVVLSGLEVTPSGSDNIYSDGYAVINGEIYFIQGGTFDNSDPLGVDIAETIDASGTETFEDLTSQDTHIVRRGILCVYSAGPTVIDITDFRTLKERFSQLGVLTTSETAWTGVTFAGAWSNASGGIYAGNAVQYKKNKTGEVVLRGICTKASLAEGTSEIVFQLPAGFRPTKTKFFSLGGSIGGSDLPMCFVGYVDISGNVYVSRHDITGTSPAVKIGFDNIILDIS